MCHAAGVRPASSKVARISRSCTACACCLDSGQPVVSILRRVVLSQQVGHSIDLPHGEACRVHKGIEPTPGFIAELDDDKELLIDRETLPPPALQQVPHMGEVLGGVGVNEQHDLPPALSLLGMTDAPAVP